MLSACVALAVPGAAAAKPGDRSFQSTYPVASKLCAQVQQGQGPKGLQGSAQQVLQACSTLQASFTQAQSAVVAANAQYTAQLQADRSQAQQACQQARKAHNRAACQQALQTFRSQTQALRAQLKAANKQFYSAAEAARKTFWSTIRSLLHGHGHIKPDAPIKGPKKH
jgi:hypothetical protein